MPPETPAYGVCCGLHRSATIAALPQFARIAAIYVMVRPKGECAMHILRQIVAAANWRCEEYADVLPQFPYLIADNPALARVPMAYIDLHNTMRAVAPTLNCRAKAMKQYGRVPKRHNR